MARAGQPWHVLRARGSWANCRDARWHTACTQSILVHRGMHMAAMSTSLAGTRNMQCPDPGSQVLFSLSRGAGKCRYHDFTQAPPSCQGSCISTNNSGGCHLFNGQTLCDNAPKVRLRLPLRGRVIYDSALHFSLCWHFWQDHGGDDAHVRRCSTAADRTQIVLTARRHELSARLRLWPAWASERRPC